LVEFAKVFATIIGAHCLSFEGAAVPAVELIAPFTLLLPGQELPPRLDSSHCRGELMGRSTWYLVVDV